MTNAAGQDILHAETPFVYDRQIQITDAFQILAAVLPDSLYRRSGTNDWWMGEISELKGVGHVRR